MTARRATFIGASAVLMWGLLALFTTQTGHVPPFQLAAMSFAVAAVLGAGKLLASGKPVAPILRQPLSAWLVGVGGLFGYHFFYFMALRNAPPVEAGLIAYLWPLLIVLFSALLPGERLRWFHAAGAVLGLAGTAILLAGRGDMGFGTEHAFGYLMAGGCALTWSAYSVLNRRHGSVPTDTVAAFCAVTAILAASFHLGFETTLWPQGAGQWLAVLGLGLLPVGAAFYAWDFGTKHGDIQVLGALSYAAPLISTALLIAFGQGSATPSVVAGCTLIVGGAALASSEMLRRKGG